MKNPLRFAGLATQWGILLALAVWGGMKLDARLGFKALFVIIFPLLALAYSFWNLLRELNRPDRRS
jgi:hypothetical protein